MTRLAVPHGIGLYVHIPFCERVCPYCDFAVVPARKLRPDDEQRYVDALVRELRTSTCAKRPSEHSFLGKN